MSNRELAIKLLNEIPESKMIFVVDILKSVKNMFIDEVKPDEWDLKMIQEAEKENNGEKVSFDEILKRDGPSFPVRGLTGPPVYSIHHLLPTENNDFVRRGLRGNAPGRLTVEHHQRMAAGISEEGLVILRHNRCRRCKVQFQPLVTA